MKTDERLAREYGVSRATIRRDARLDEQVTRIVAVCGEHVRAVILTATAA